MPNPNILVREAVAADAESLYTLILGLAEHHNQRAAVRTSVDAMLRDGFGDHPRFGAFLAEAHRGLIGYTSFTWNYSIWLGSTYMNIDDVFVLDSHRGQGIGEAMLLAARQMCQARGIPRIRWEVQTDNAAAIRFYERLGATMRTKGVFVWDV